MKIITEKELQRLLIKYTEDEVADYLYEYEIKVVKGE